MYTDELNAEDLIHQDTFKVLQQSLDDPQLLEEPMYIKLRARITAFFLKHEVDRLAAKKNPEKAKGKPDDMQGFAIELYKCLRQMMLHIINLKEMPTKKKQLRQVYEWFFAKLKAIGALSKEEIEEEFKFLNPNKGMMTQSMKKILGRKVQQLCANEDYMGEVKREMYEGRKPERSWNKDINPTSMRIKSYKTKHVNEVLIKEKVDEIKYQEQKLTMERLRTAQPHSGMLSLGVNSVYEIQTMSATGLTDSTRPSTTVASQLSQF